MSVKNLKNKLNNILTKDKSESVVVISLMCFAVAYQAFFFLEITCKNISVRILEIVSLPNKET
jgi:hypothetical protein